MDEAMGLLEDQHCPEVAVGGSGVWIDEVWIRPYSLRKLL